ncbi:SURP and G-patch domain-containing protein 1 [Coemansia sp. RSA 2049]|nr:SURP and G-patch domain-containing protein 1 [Coemansia sp. RSA 2049]
MMPRMSSTTTVRPPPPGTAESEVGRLPVDERMVFEKMVEAYHRNPELVDMVKQSQRGNPKYAFLFEGCRLHRCFQHRTGQRPRGAGRVEEESSGNTTHRASAAPCFRPPPPVPPPEALASMRSADPASHGASDPAVHLLRYHSLPAGLMVALVSEDRAAPYSALRTSVLESTGFLDSVAPNLLSYLPGTTASAAAKTPREEKEKAPDSMEQAVLHFERGLCYIYKEGEFQDRDNPFASRDTQHAVGAASPPPAIMDKDGWAPGALERVLWDRRRGSGQRRRWRRIRDRECRRAAGEDASSSSESSASDGSEEEEEEEEDGSSSSSSSSSGSDSDSSSGSSSSRARSGHPARQRANPRRSANSTGGSSSVNKAIGSDNVGFKMLAKLGWQQGQGLGASNDGIVEPIRPQTRFSTRGAPVERASLGTGRLGHDADKPDPTDSSLADTAADNKAGDEFEAYRRQMSSAYTKHQS